MHDNRFVASMLIEKKNINWQFKKPFKMTFKELNKINNEDAFRQSRMQQLRSILLLLTTGGIFLVLCWQFFDKYYLGQNDPKLMWLRLITIAVYLINLAIAYIRQTNNAFRQHLTAGFYFGTTFCMLLAMFTGSSESPYWFGLFFILIGWFVLVPFTYRELIIHSFMFFLMFLAGIFAQSGFQIVGYEIAKIIFLYSGTLFIGFYAAYTRNSTEAETYLTNKELKNKNTNLSKYLLVLEQAPGSVFIMDNKMNFEYINPGFTQLSGYTKEDLLHKNINETLYKGKMPESRAGVGDALQKGEKWQGELLTYHKSGQSYWANTIAAPYKDENGSIEGYIVIQQDITDHKKMEISLRESEQLYRTLIEKSLDGVGITINRKFFLVNDAFCNLFGYSREEILEIRSESLIAPEDRERVLEIHDKRMSGNLNTLHYVAKFLHKSGKQLTIEMNSTTVQVDGKNSSFVTMRDITEQHSLKEALEQSESKYKTLIENSQDGIFAIAGDKILFANKTFSKMLGFSADELYSIPAHHLLMPADRKHGIEFSERRQQGDFSTLNDIFHFVAKNGEIKEADVFSSVVELNGQIVSYITVHDLTETRRMQEQLQLSEEKYRTVIDKATDGIVITQQGKLKFLNASMCEMLGYEETEIIDKPFLDYVIAEDHQVMIDFHKRRMEGEDFTSLYRSHFIRKNGEIITVELNARTSVYNGQPAAFIIIRNISERLAMEVALQKSEERFRRMIQSLQEGLFVVQDEKFVFVNEAIVDIVGYTVDELLGKPFFDVIPPEKMEFMVNRHGDRKNGEKGSWSYEYTLLHKDGITRVPVILSTNLTEVDGKMAVVGTAKDITQRIIAETELREAHNRLEEINHMLEETITERTRELTEANTQLLKLQKENLQSQFDVLKQQVNPHFLFNSLNVLTSLIRLEPELAEKFTEHLSKVYRYVLENKDNELVKLTTELDFLDAYIFLLNIRFMGKIAVNITISEEKKNCLVIPLAMQLLIENAIKHNAMSKKSPLVIDIFIDENHFLNIINNLQEREAHMVSTGVGLKNIQNRYLLLNNSAPEFEKTETHFIARIPLICEQLT
jgi:PAS domain S-box-containing protein